MIGSSSYHDIVPAVERLEIGYTWYAKSRQRTHVNASAKLLLMTHAFETLGARLVGWRTDNFNFASQRAIERLGARKDGVLRHHALRRDGTMRDTVMYSMTAGEWPEAKAELKARLARRATESKRHGTRRPRFPLRSRLALARRRCPAGACRAAAARARAARALGRRGRARDPSGARRVRARERRTSSRIDFAAAPALRAALRRRAAADVIVVPQGVLDELAATGAVVAGPRAPIGRVGVGVAVRPGVAAPDIGSVDALRAALARRRHIVFNRASTGVYVEQMLQRLGVADAVRAEIGAARRRRVGDAAPPRRHGARASSASAR